MGMLDQWLSWGGGNRSIKRGRPSGGERETTPPSGCMNSVFQLFDIHQFHHQPPFNPQSLIPEKPILLKGVEAPRNSLELEDTAFMGPAEKSSTKNGEEPNLNIPMGMRIKTISSQTKSSRTGASKKRTDHDLCSECSSSPGAKTPTLVARLMGLDLLPETCSPRISSSSSHHPSRPILQSRVHKLKKESRKRWALQQNRPNSNKNGSDDIDLMGSRSLPETPRISSARRSDVDQRLSLQINKENREASEEFEFSKFLTSKIAARRKELIRQEDVENMSPGQYAREMVKQFKESVDRRVGADITNTVKNREQRRDEHVVLLKSKKPSSRAVVDESTSSCSPRLRFLEPKNKSTTTSSSATKNQTYHSSKLSLSSLSSLQDKQYFKSETISSKPKGQLPQKDQQEIKNRPKKLPQTLGTFHNKQEESFVRSSTTNRSTKKCKKTPLSNVPNLVSVKKSPFLPPPTRLTQKKEEKRSQSKVFDIVSSKKCTQLSSCLSQSYKKEATLPDNKEDHHIYNCATSGIEHDLYISRILNCMGIDEKTPLSIIKWYSPSHPLDPFIFHNLENSFPATTAAAGSGGTESTVKQLCNNNRKLMFELVDELLREILKPFANIERELETQILYGGQLMNRLCKRIRSFPLADCRVLEDIDALIDKDMGKKQIEKSAIFEEEGDGVVADIERDIAETLLHETVMVMWLGERKGGI